MRIMGTLELEVFVLHRFTVGRTDGSTASFLGPILTPTAASAVGVDARPGVVQGAGVYTRVVDSAFISTLFIASSTWTNISFMP